jgi:serine phosphatase RsbU (regulator of sigma subunit)
MTRAGQRAGQAGSAARSEPATLTTDPRGTLIVYTDGLVERRGESLDAGLRRLQQPAARDCSPLEDLLGGIVTELTGGSPTDDIALIGLRWLN